MNFPCSPQNRGDNSNNMVVMLFLARNQIPTCTLKVGSILRALSVTRMVRAARTMCKYHVLHPISLSFGYIKCSFWSIHRPAQLI